MADKTSCVGNVHINVDVSEAVKGLKAVQREVRKTIAALKEVDEIQKHTCPECGKMSLKTLLANEVVQSRVCVYCGWSNVVIGD
ncbi:putative RNA-binding Zn-ribbon protein involved in translation (DUF1610 family) [Salirhabdus euzebyi]|uniref:Putative RNA-binding Zn-ribbon protein involved in translation (DUF1610 family) n=1 Tax=Salirhabdus euzebyi TaxID=394506 RepID=A0A841PX67_9BACI|nr:hypothetical protein [Salirhabdus euzebyi]MBB6451996.1 putative RNA-binding Zn-ribbon protein involved in translation (DUF1610 family) [Salirhabdus euzebyi]